MQPPGPAGIGAGQAQMFGVAQIALVFAQP